MPGPLVVPVALGIGQILGNLFGNLFGASKQASAARDATKLQGEAAVRAAELQKQSIDEALAYTKEIDARDYRDWLTREARDRADWEASEQRRAPYRALGDSAVRTLADYIRVPGMQPAREVPVQRWSDPHVVQQTPPVSTTMPVGGTMRAYVEPGVAPPSLLGKFGRTPRTLADFAL
jgi:hypothetical protein